MFETGGPVGGGDATCGQLAALVLVLVKNHPTATGSSRMPSIVGRQTAY